MLLGKTGVGKSTSGNTILENKSFITDLSSASVTTECKTDTRKVNGQTLSVTDTPGLFHTNKNHKAVMKEILDCSLKISPGPHVFLLVLKLGSFSRDDKKTLEQFQKVFKDAEQFTIVLFTHGDRDQKAEEFIERNKSLKEFIRGRVNRYHVFNNRVEDASQVTGLLEKINNMVQKNKGSHYSNEMLEKAKRGLDDRLDDLLDFLNMVMDVAFDLMPPEAYRE